MPPSIPATHWLLQPLGRVAGMGTDTLRSPLLPHSLSRWCFLHRLKTDRLAAGLAEKGRV